MAIDWGTLKGYIRTGLLKDVPTSAGITVEQSQFTDAELLIAARWGCVYLSQRFAQETTLTFTCDGVAFTFALPDTLVDDVERTGLVILHRANDIEYLAPIRTLPGEQWPVSVQSESSALTRGYYHWQDLLQLTFIPNSTDTIELRCWKNWNAPLVDADLLTFPIRLEQPFAYIVSAFAFDPLGAQASAIRTWNRKTDSGTPEDNSLHQQSQYFLMMADKLLAAVGPQDRETYYNQSPRDVGFKR